MESEIITASHSLQEIKTFLETNKDKIFTLVSVNSSINDTNRYVFNYKDCYFDDTWGCNQVQYKFMVPMDYTKHISHYTLYDDMCFEDEDYIRLADESEIKSFEEMYQKYEAYKKKIYDEEDIKLMKKYDLLTKSELLNFIVGKLLKSNNITETLKDILK